MKTILIVEDTITLRESLVEEIKNAGYNVLVATNGEEGLQTALLKHPDLILLDIIMPKMDGITVMKQLRRTNEWGKTVPIIISTVVDPDNKILNEIMINQPSYYLLKGKVKLSEVMDKIKEILQPEVKLV